MRVALLFLSLFSFSVFAQSSNYSLTVKVSNLRNDKGLVQFSLYDKDGSLPDEHFKQYLMQQKSIIKDNTAFVAFNNLPKGNYAVNILHDENKDGKIDINPAA